MFTWSYEYFCLWRALSRSFLVGRFTAICCGDNWCWVGAVGDPVHRCGFVGCLVKKGESSGLYSGSPWRGSLPDFFDLVVQIRKRDALASIIIVADSLFFMEEVFRSQVGVLDYILRDLPPIRFHQRLATVLLQIQSYFIQDTPKELILIRNSQVQIQIPVRKVFYIERSFRAHYISIVTSDEEVSVIANLQDVKATSPFLFSCHRSFLVNPFNIRRVDRQLRLALFPKGYSCPISRNRMMELLNLIHFQCQACSRDDKRT